MFKNIPFTLKLYMDLIFNLLSFFDILSSTKGAFVKSYRKILTQFQWNIINILNEQSFT